MSDKDKKKKKKKKKNQPYSILSGKPYNYMEHGFLPNLEMGTFESAMKGLKGGVRQAKRVYRDVKRDVKKGIKTTVKKNFPPGSDFSKAVKKWKKGGKVHFRNNPQHD